MAFCPKCGSRLRDGAKFCEECGESVQQTQKSKGEQRKQVFEGDVRKCPNCGQPLGSFSTRCVSCGYEIRGAQVSDSVKEFSNQISAAKDENQRIILVRNFPVPNTKEDILEFVFLAYSNLSYKANNSVDDAIIGKKEFDAWMAKLDLCYKKAELMLSDDDSFSKIKSVYEELRKEEKKQNKRIKKVTIISAIITFLVICAGIGLLISGCLARRHQNAGVFFGCIVIIATCVGLFRKSASLVDTMFCILGALALEIMPLFYNESDGGDTLMQLAGVISILIIVTALIVSRIRSRTKHDSYYEEEE